MRRGRIHSQMARRSVRRFPFERGKGFVRLFEEAGDGIRHHVEMKINY